MVRPKFKTQNDPNTPHNPEAQTNLNRVAGARVPTLDYLQSQDPTLGNGSRLTIHKVWTISALWSKQNRGSKKHYGGQDKPYHAVAAQQESQQSGCKDSFRLRKHPAEKVAQTYTTAETQFAQ